MSKKRKEEGYIVVESCPFTNINLEPKTYSVRNFVIQCIKWTRYRIIIFYIRMPEVAEAC